MTIPAEEAARHREVAGHFSSLVRGTASWSAPAPVEGWTAGDVVDHLTTWLPGLLESVGATLPAVEPAVEDRVTGWNAHVCGVQSLLDDPASRDLIVHSPHFPEMSLTQMIDRLYTTDVFLHSWDLARATGQDDRLDAAHCADLFAGMEPLEEMLLASGQYGPRVVVPEDASAQDRLIGFIGRDPGWTPPS